MSYRIDNLKKVEFSLNEIKVNIDPRILKKLNQKQNRNRR